MQQKIQSNSKSGPQHTFPFTSSKIKWWTSTGVEQLLLNSNNSFLNNLWIPQSSSLHKCSKLRNSMYLPWYQQVPGPPFKTIKIVSYPIPGKRLQLTPQCEWYPQRCAVQFRTVACWGGYIQMQIYVMYIFSGIREEWFLELECQHFLI